MSKALFDTSIIVAALWANHPRHSACVYWLQQIKNKKIKGIIATHTLAELYSVLTSLPITPRLSPPIVQQLIKENLATFEIIPLTIDDYQSVINQMATLNLAGGTIYDALIAHAALKAEVDRILTLNPKHFTRFGETIAQLVTALE